MQSSCSVSKCGQRAVAFFPAFDRTVPPTPYCEKHLEQAKRTQVLEGPRFLDMLKPKRELATI